MENTQEAQIGKSIYPRYLSGLSLGGPFQSQIISGNRITPNNAGIDTFFKTIRCGIFLETQNANIDYFVKMYLLCPLGSVVRQERLVPVIFARELSVGKRR